jgi:hypothetical protein
MPERSLVTVIIIIIIIIITIDDRVAALQE